MAATEQDTARPCGGILLSGTLHVHGKPRFVTLSETVFSWESLPSDGVRRSAEHSLGCCKRNMPVGEIVTARHVENSSEHRKPSETQEIEMITLTPTSFELCFMKRGSGCRWRLESLKFTCPSSSDCALWVDTIQSLLENSSCRPRSLLVFVNPFGGNRKAPKIYEEKVAPVFALAGINTHVIVTQFKNQAYDFLLAQPLHRYDGIVAVGGDGMYAEVLQGLLLRHNRDSGVDVHDAKQRLLQPPLRIGIVPAGSTDAVVYCTVGTNDVMTAALHIVLGDDLAVDVTSVRQAATGKLLGCSVCFLGYGFYGDVIKDSEEFRWMGPKRYDWSGFKKVLKMKSYHATVQYLPAPPIVEGHHPLNFRSRCYSGCSICHSVSLAELASAAGSLGLRDDDKSQASESGDTFTLDSVSQGSLSYRYRRESEWRSVEGNFVCINAATKSCRCEKTPEGVSPTGHLSDGCTDLILVRSSSRFDYVRHMYRYTTSKYDQFDFDFVEVHRVRELRVRVPPPEVSTDTAEVEANGGGGGSSVAFQRLRSQTRAVSGWNCDGEFISEPNVDIKVNCQLIKMFVRGIEPTEMYRHSVGTNCISCVASAAS